MTVQTSRKRFEIDAAEVMTCLRADLVGAIEITPAGDRRELIDSAVAELGGSLIAPRNGWGPHQWELSLLGVMGIDDSFEGALADWSKCASRSLGAGT